MVIWFTGLSGSGKTAIASALQKRLEQLGERVEVVDGDVVRKTLHRHLGFSPADIHKNNHLIAGLAKDKAAVVDFVLVPIISPFKGDRDKARKLIGKNFVEIFVNCPLAVCQKRDVKGLYKKAQSGELDNMIGVSPAVPYEAPQNPDLEIRTDKLNLDGSVEKVLFFLKKKGLLQL